MAGEDANALAALEGASTKAEIVAAAADGNRANIEPALKRLREAGAIAAQSRNDKCNHTAQQVAIAQLVQGAVCRQAIRPYYTNYVSIPSANSPMDNAYLSEGLYARNAANCVE
jgi:hypothetical protein